ncbi:hypothetical protein CDA63_15225 [Hymenobacter amundsenii]|uniref:Uncharacterized protein n=1 Tax=Hymenobacter amundsenii TaxID=2006685 RepID=A0A246FI92_9BACT|nr:hypothetical protein [Hymenobacter amundsenii]OWP62252.1 hypothetical protein CDA63_15225 [Hymenobacter amundsenii]
MRVRSSFRTLGWLALAWMISLAALLTVVARTLSVPQLLLGAGVPTVLLAGLVGYYFGQVSTREGLLRVRYPLRFPGKTYLLLHSEVTALSVRRGLTTTLVFHLGREMAVSLSVAALDPAAIAAVTAWVGQQGPG